ncbi:MAG: VWA domain-containing protein, partial [Holophagales bacterium]|nr:VWA domain-containing protein [Holophagales bacterium]
MILAAPAFLVGAASATPPAETFSDITTTVLVEVPVEVTLENEPVRGLGIEDFELFDDGDRVEIQWVEEVDLARITGDSGAAGGVRQMPVVARRHFLLLFDTSFASPASLAKAREAARNLVLRDLHPADLVAVAVFGLDRGVQIPLGFTTDRGQVALAIRALEAPQSVAGRSDPLRLYVGDARASSLGEEQAIQGSASGERGSMINDQLRSLQTMADRAQATQGRREVSAMTRSLSELATLLHSVDGRKHVVFFSEGFDSELLLGSTDDRRRAEMVRRAQDNAIWDVDSSEYFGSADTLNVLDDMVREFRRADCLIHSVDIGGLRAGGEAGRPSLGGKDGLFMMASGTGGSFYENFNNLGQAMGRMLNETSVTYVLSYQPRDLRFDGDYRKLKVRVPGLPRKAKVSHRPGYYAPDPDAERSGVEVRMSLAQRLLDGREGGAISARVLATPMRLPVDIRTGPSSEAVAGVAWVPVLVEVDGESFLRAPKADPGKTRERKRSRRGKRGGAEAEGAAPADPDLLRGEVYLYALDPAGSIADFFAQSVELDLRSMGDDLRRRGFKVFAPMLLPQGAYDLRVLVRNSTTEQTGLAVAPVVVPDLAEEAVVLLPPLFPESSDEWLLVRGRRPELSADREPPYPFFHSGTTYVPAARPELRPGDPLPVFLAGYGLEGTSGLDSSLLDSRGEPVAVPRWKLDPRVMVGEDGMERYIAALEVPRVRPGEYRLELSLEGKAGRSSVGRTAVRILAEGQASASQLLTLTSPVSFETPVGAEGFTQRASAPASAEEQESMAMPEVERAYGRALGRLSSASLEDLVPEVAALEARAVAENPQRQAGRLNRSLLRAARRLADA